MKRQILDQFNIEINSRTKKGTGVWLREQETIRVVYTTNFLNKLTENNYIVLKGAGEEKRGSRVKE